MLSSSMSRIPTFFAPSLSAGSIPHLYSRYSHSVPFGVLPLNFISNNGTRTRMPTEYLNVDPCLPYGMNYIPVSTIEPNNIGFTRGYGKWNNIRYNYGNTDNKSWNRHYELSSDNEYKADEYNGTNKRGLRRYPWNNGYDMGVWSTGVMTPFHFQPLTLSTEPINDTAESCIDIDRLSGDKIKLKKWTDGWKSEVNKHKISAMSREEASMILLCAKKEQGLTFSDIAKKLGHSEFWTTSAILGQQKFDDEEAKMICQLLKIDQMFDKKVVERLCGLLSEVPMRGSLHGTTPTDPSIYCLYELFQMYGTTFKALLNEKFGDGIMSTVDVKLNLDKKTDTEGNQHVMFTIDGNFVPYQKW